MDHPTDTPHNGPPGPAETLEQRLRRLEDALANLQDTQSAEQRVVERVSERLQSSAGPTPPRAPAQTVTESRPLPAPGLQLPLPMSMPGLPSLGAIQHAWLLFDLWTELRAMFRMFFDRRYHVAWGTRLTLFVLGPAILLSDWWLPLSHLPIAGPILERAVDVILSFFLYKSLSREATRYRQALAAAGQPL